MKTQRERAELFRSLHQGDRLLILPNAWDVPTARIFEDLGFPAVATSSAAQMVALGYPDGERIPEAEFLASVGRIARVLSVPLSVDIVGGFGADSTEVRTTVKRVIQAGAVGINIEDVEHESKQLHSVEEQVRKLEAIRTLGESEGVPLVINARTDALRFAPGDDEARFQEAVRRATAYRDAGADCVYPMGLADAAGIGRFVKEVSCPVNVMVRKGLPPAAELERLGVKRVSFGPAGAYAVFGFLMRAAKQARATGTWELLTEGAIAYDELNRLGMPKT